MDKSYPISKIFDIEGLIWSFDIEVIGPATYVRSANSAQTLRKHCANHAQTLWHIRKFCGNIAQQCGNIAQTLRKQCANAAQTLRKRCANAAQTLRQRCANAVQTCVNLRKLLIICVKTEVYCLKRLVGKAVEALGPVWHFQTLCSWL